MKTWAKLKNVAVVAVVVVAAGRTCAAVAAKGPSTDSRFESPAAIGGAKGKAPVARDFQPFAEKWVCASATSAIVYWQTGEHARNVDAAGTGYVEYGLTADYGERTDKFHLPPVCKEVPAGVRVYQKPSWSQFHRLTGLEPGNTYHYRMVHIARDETIVKSDDMPFRTRDLDGAIRIPGDADGPPFALDTAGATYVLTRDLAADGTVFDFQADNITLDLDGHRVVYGQKAAGESHGVTATNWSRPRGLTIANGGIEQGGGGGRACHPVMLSGSSDVEISGLNVTYYGKDGQGILFNWSGADCDVHHNVIDDTGTETTSRHQQINAIGFSRGGSGSKAHHNIILRCRQSGIGFWGSTTRTEARNFEVYNNTIYMGSCMTNSMGLAAYGMVRDFRFYNNRIYGRGEMPQSIAVLSGASHGKIFDNHAFARSTGKVSEEYGATSSLAAAFRACWGPHHIEVHDNTFITISGKTDGFTGNARCFWAACSDPRQPAWKGSGEIHVHDNEITAIVDETGEGYARAITVCGNHEASARGLVFAENRISSNRNCVVLSESYGCGSSDVKFVGNTFVRAGDDPRFVLLSCGFWDKPTTGSTLIDSRFEGGAGYDRVVFSGTAERNFSVGWTLTLQTTPGAEVSIQDTTGREVFSGKADAHGTIKAELIQYVQAPDRKIVLTPHTVIVGSGGSTATTTITMDRSRSYRFDGS